MSIKEQTRITYKNTKKNNKKAYQPEKTPRKTHTTTPSDYHHHPESKCHHCSISVAINDNRRYGATRLADAPDPNLLSSGNIQNKFEIALI